MISGGAISALPDVQHLSDICFPGDDIVIEFIGSHCDSFSLNATFGPTVTPEPPDPEENSTNGTNTNAASTNPFPNFHVRRCIAPVKTLVNFRGIYHCVSILV